MDRLTGVTKRDIRDALVNGIEVEVGFLETKTQTYHFSGRLTDSEFLSRLYDTSSMPGSGGRCKTLDQEIWQHTVNNDDWSSDWVFDDSRFPLKNGSDVEYLTFICEMFHPEVRDEKQNWRALLSRINWLLRQDHYEIYPKGIISGRDVYGWRDLQVKRKYNAISNTEIKNFLTFLNRGGYVLNFSTPSFDEFTFDVVGVGLCSRYGLSKGKSLEQYVCDASEQEIIKLFKALIDYYETQQDYNEERESDKKYGLLYKRCKEVIANIHIETTLLAEHAIQIKQQFSSDYISSLVEIMYANQSENPTESIGKAKELIESCCKTILENKGIQMDKKWDVNRLVTETRKLLRITPKDIPENIPEAEAMRALLGSLSTITNNIAQLRNVYGSGHGKSANYKGLQERHAKLAIGCSVTLVNFLWDSYQRQINNK